jgi:hypothetical protein
VESSLRPYFRKPFLLSKPEKYFYNVLREIVGNYTVLTKVRLADLVETNKGHPRQRGNFNRVRSKHIDFVVCDDWLRPVIAIELDGSSHQLPERRERDAIVDQILATASLPIIHVSRRGWYDHDEIAKLLLAKLMA